MELGLGDGTQTAHNREREKLEEQQDSPEQGAQMHTEPQRTTSIQHQSTGKGRYNPEPAHGQDSTRGQRPYTHASTEGTVGARPVKH